MGISGEIEQIQMPLSSVQYLTARKLYIGCKRLKLLLGVLNFVLRRSCWENWCLLAKTFVTAEGNDPSESTQGQACPCVLSLWAFVRAVIKLSTLFYWCLTTQFCTIIFYIMPSFLGVELVADVFVNGTVGGTLVYSIFFRNCLNSFARTVINNLRHSIKNIKKSQAVLTVSARPLMLLLFATEARFFSWSRRCFVALETNDRGMCRNAVMS